MGARRLPAKTLGVCANSGANPACTGRYGSCRAIRGFDDGSAALAERELHAGLYRFHPTR